MRKLQALLAMILFFSIISPGIAIAQQPVPAPAPTPETPVQAPKTAKVTVEKDGTIKDASGKIIDHRLFPFTFYDEAGKNRLKEGTARSRPETMYIDESVLTTEALKALNDKDSLLRKEYERYMSQEPRLNPRQQRRNRRERSTNPDRTVTASVKISDQQLKELASEIVSKTAATQKAEFKEYADQVLAQNKAQLDQYFKELASKIPTPAPGTAIVVPGSITDSPRFLTNPSQWFNSLDPTQRFFVVLAAILVLAILLKLGYFLYRRSRSASNEPPSITHIDDGENTVKVKEEVRKTEVKKSTILAQEEVLSNPEEDATAAATTPGFTQVIKPSTGAYDPSEDPTGRQPV